MTKALPVSENISKDYELFPQGIGILIMDISYSSKKIFHNSEVAYKEENVKLTYLTVDSRRLSYKFNSADNKPPKQVFSKDKALIQN